MLQSFKSLPEFQFVQPITMKEALDLFSANDVVPLAGGSDLILELRRRIKTPKMVVDLKKIPELRTISYNDKDGLTIGATATYKELQAIPEIFSHYIAFFEAMKKLCDAILRGRAGPVGNICTASPASDSAPSLMIFDAKITIVSSEGERELLLNEFFTGVKKNALKQNEIVSKIIVPPVVAGTKSTYRKMMRSAEDLAVAGVAVLWRKNGSDSTLRIGLSSVAPTPLYLNLDAVVNNTKGNLNQKIDLVIKTVLEKINPISDVRGGAAYRKHIVEVLIRQSLKDLVGG